LILIGKLKEASRINHRSLNSEILYCVERTLNTHKIDVDEHLRIARQLRAKTAKYPLMDEQIDRAKAQGRS
jgi:antitoxin FitA